nr:hypothetical protein RAR13_03100 [Aminobacter aminovorans]
MAGVHALMFRTWWAPSRLADIARKAKLASFGQAGGQPNARPILCLPRAAHACLAKNKQKKRVQKQKKKKKKKKQKKT